MSNTKPYTFSFTAASALIPETMVIAEELARLGDWKKVETALQENNLLKKVKHSTFKREFNEIRKRLILLTPNQLQLLIHGSYDDTKAMILVAVCKAYVYVRDFIVDVVRTKYQMFENKLSEPDYIRFFNEKSISHDELANLTVSTSKKVKQVVFKLLEQLGLIDDPKTGTIIKPMPGNQVIEVILEDNPSLLAVFLYASDEIKNFVKPLKHA
jgi:hypothetical protein